MHEWPAYKLEMGDLCFLFSFHLLINACSAVFHILLKVYWNLFHWNDLQISNNVFFVVYCLLSNHLADAFIQSDCIQSDCIRGEFRCMWLRGRGLVSGVICSWRPTGWRRTLGIRPSTYLGWDFNNWAANMIQPIVLIWCGHAFS